MLTKYEKSLHPFLFGLGIVTVAFASLITVFSSESGGRILTEVEMSALFGDNNHDPCKKKYLCSTAFASGGANCGFCKSGTGDNDRQMCCNLGNGTSCDYTGAANCGQGYTWYVGAINGQAGTCNTCTSNAYFANGGCSGINDANGAACP